MARAGVGALLLVLGTGASVRAQVPQHGEDDLGASGGRVYLTRAEAFHEIFEAARCVITDRWSLRAEDVSRIEAAAATAVPDPRPRSYRVYGEHDQLLGYAMVLSERGKYRPITFMVGLRPDFSVKGVEVMVYREDRGDEVRYPRFLRQYRGKREGDPIRTHRDIINITGATISVQSLNNGVRRALSTLALLYGDEGRQPESPFAERCDAVPEGG